jgi:hypothetical protein
MGYVYFIYGTNQAIDFFEKSPQFLMDSDCYDFDVVKISKLKDKFQMKDNIIPAERVLIIDKETYNKLYLNICHKLKKYIVDPHIIRLGKKANCYK